MPRWTLVDMAGPSFEYRTRVNAFAALRALNHLDSTLVLNLCDALIHPNNRLRGPAEEATVYFLGQAAHRELFTAVVQKHTWTPDAAGFTQKGSASRLNLTIRKARWLVRVIVSVYFWAFMTLSSLLLYPVAVIIRCTTFPFDKRLTILHRFTSMWGRSTPGARQSGKCRSPVRNIFPVILLTSSSLIISRSLTSLCSFVSGSTTSGFQRWRISGRHWLDGT